METQHSWLSKDSGTKVEGVYRNESAAEERKTHCEGTGTYTWTVNEDRIRGPSHVRHLELDVRLAMAKAAMRRFSQEPRGMMET